LEMLQPSRRRGEMILVLQLFDRGIVEKPKAVIGEATALKTDRRQTKKKPRIFVELAHKNRPAGQPQKSTNLPSRNWARFRNAPCSRLIPRDRGTAARSCSSGRMLLYEKAKPEGSTHRFALLFARRAAPAFDAFGRPIAVQIKSPMETTSSRSIPVSSPRPCSRYSTSSEATLPVAPGA